MANGRDNRLTIHPPELQPRIQYTTDEPTTPVATPSGAATPQTVAALDDATFDMVGDYQTNLEARSPVVAPLLTPFTPQARENVGLVVQAQPPPSAEQRRLAEGAEEADRGLDRQERGENVVGIADSDNPLGGENRGILPWLAGDDPEMQRFGRLHDIQAAMAEQGNEGLGFTIANAVTAAIGAGSTMLGEAHPWIGQRHSYRPDRPGEIGAAAANEAFGWFGYSTNEYEEIANEAATRRRSEQ